VTIATPAQQVAGQLPVNCRLIAWILRLRTGRVYRRACRIPSRTRQPDNGGDACISERFLSRSSDLFGC
jgi:hypothetical protein